MIETKFEKIEVVTENEAVCLRIEDKNENWGMLNLCWLDENQVGKLIMILNESKKKMEERRNKITKIMETTNFTKLYDDFENRYNPYPVQMSRCSAFAHALGDGLINRDTYDAAKKYYGKLWEYVGD